MIGSSLGALRLRGLKQQFGCLGLENPFSAAFNSNNNITLMDMGRYKVSSPQEMRLNRRVQA